MHERSCITSGGPSDVYMYVLCHGIFIDTDGDLRSDLTPEWSCYGTRGTCSNFRRLSAVESDQDHRQEQRHEEGTHPGWLFEHSFPSLLKLCSRRARLSSASMGDIAIGARIAGAVRSASICYGAVSAGSVEAVRSASMGDIAVSARIAGAVRSASICDIAVSARIAGAVRSASICDSAIIVSIVVVQGSVIMDTSLHLALLAQVARLARLWLMQQVVKAESMTQE